MKQYIQTQTQQEDYESQSGQSGGTSNSALNDIIANLGDSLLPLVQAAGGKVHIGMRDSDAVRWLQNFLTGTYDVGPVDGHFGNMTYRAVQSFQRTHNLYVDGWVGLQTASYIDSLGQGSGSRVATQTPTQESPAQEAPVVETPPATPGVEGDLFSQPFLPLVQAAGGKVHIGMRDSDAVRWLQNFLTGTYDVGPVDGHFGNMTYRAVQSFQRTHNLYVDGWVGPQTASYIDSLGQGSGAQSGGSQTPTVETPSLETPAQESAQESSQQTQTPGQSNNTNTNLGQLNNVQNVVNQLKVYLNGSEASKDRYDVFYDNGAQGDELATYMRNNNSQSNTYRDASTPIERVYPSESSIGLHHIESFINNGHFAQLQPDEQQRFIRAISQLGSFYGQKGVLNPDNGLDWLPPGVDIYGPTADAYFTEQDSNNTGKWDCSGFAAYVQQTSGGLSSNWIVDNCGTINWNLTGQAMKEQLPTGSAIARKKVAGGPGGHVIVILGHTSAGCLVSEAVGSKWFLNASMKTYTKLRDSGFTNVKQP